MLREANHSGRRGVRHEMSSPALTLGLWVRITLKSLMFVYGYSVCVLSCVRYWPCDWLILRPRRPTDSLKARNLSETKRFTDVLCSKWEQQKQI
jgi:hypothetical protein